MEWTEIEKRLCDQAELVCRHLLPNGKRVGPEYVCGSVGGESGDSLKVHVTPGPKAGVWRDFASDKGGKTLMSLWCAVRSQAFRNCIVEAKGFLGIRDDFERRVKSYAAATVGTSAADERREATAEESSWREVSETWSRCEPVTSGPVFDYLAGTRRLAPEVLDLYGVRQMVSNGKWVMVFPYFTVRPLPETAGLESGNGDGGGGSVGAPSWLKLERLDRVGGKKAEWTTRGPEKCLFGMQVASRAEFREAQHLLICEGEKDALSWASYGCATWSATRPAGLVRTKKGEGILPVSVPFGAKWKGQERGRPSPNREWLDRCWDWMQGFETVLVAMDSDEAGRRAAADIITEIGPRRCRLVELPPTNVGATGRKET